MEGENIVMHVSSVAPFPPEEMTFGRWAGGMCMFLGTPLPCGPFATEFFKNVFKIVYKGGSP